MACRSNIDSIEFVHLERTRALEPETCRLDTPGAAGSVPETVPAETALSGAGPVQSSLARLDQASPERLADAGQNQTFKPLQLVPPGPWRSLGGYLDYRDWPDRERFHDLDRAIELQAWKECDHDDDASREKYTRGLAALKRPVPTPISRQKAASAPETATETILPPERR